MHRRLLSITPLARTAARRPTLTALSTTNRSLRTSTYSLFSTSSSSPPSSSPPSSASSFASPPSPRRPFAFVPPGAPEPPIVQPLQSSPAASSPSAPSSSSSPPLRSAASSPADRCPNPYLTSKRKTTDRSLFNDSPRPSYQSAYTAASPLSDSSSLTSPSPSSSPPSSPPSSSTSSSASSLASVAGVEGEGGVGLVSSLDASFPRPLPAVYVVPLFDDAGLPSSTLNTPARRAYEVFKYVLTGLVLLYIALEGDVYSPNKEPHVFTPLRLRWTEWKKERLGVGQTAAVSPLSVSSTSPSSASAPLDRRAVAVEQSRAVRQ